MVQDDVRYETKSVKAVRGLEARTIAKWAQEGWELETQTPGRVRTELLFRRPKKAMPKGLLIGIGGLAALVVVGGITGAVLMSGGTPTEPTAAPGSPTPSTEPSAIPSEPSGVPSEPSPTPQTASEAPELASEKPEQPTAVAEEPYAYAGPQYDVVVVDRNQGPARLTSYWVSTQGFDYSTEAYREQVKLLVADVARAEGAAELIVQVVTDRDIALAESPSTYQAFAAERGTDYVVNTIPQKEKLGWVATYTGGFDYNTGKASRSARAYEVVWRPYATSELETWKPTLTD